MFSIQAGISACAHRGTREQRQTKDTPLLPRAEASHHIGQEVDRKLAPDIQSGISYIFRTPNIARETQRKQ